MGTAVVLRLRRATSPDAALGNEIDWDCAWTAFDLGNGSSIYAWLPNTLGPFAFIGGSPFDLNLSTSTACGAGNYCGSSDLYIAVTDNDPAATPEPSSLALFGTGVLGIAGTLRRKFVLS